MPTRTPITQLGVTGIPPPHALQVITLHIGNDIEDATRRAVELLGGMHSLLDGRRVAVLKPNFVAGRSSQTGATTNLRLIAAVAEAVHAAGAEPVLCEFPGTEFDYEATYTILGLEEFCRRHEIRILRQVDRWLEVRPDGARRLKRFHVPAELADGCFINLPVLKTHVVSGMSVAMKNLMGLLPRRDRRTMHTLGIQQCIVDLNRGIRPALNIVDGSVGQDGNGPLYGRAANLGVIVAGRDTLAVDLACCQLCGVDPLTIGHWRLGQAQFGECHPQVIGESVGRLASFALPKVSALYRFAFWLMYALDYPLHWLTGDDLCTILFKTGMVGTRPRIIDSACTRCGKCVDACPLPEAIDLHSLRVNLRTCQRCLLCVEACPEGAIAVAGMSGAQKAPATAGAGGAGGKRSYGADQ